eukprot:TRINITY_DN28927_c0_g1_i1.p1 TRINITY_DN28927_c0_g1~~TRINITY_DN28927_c0_g1_i1.p1  ORF type:complete len:394 (-),score=30.04 TRINITY_DN28927_c0_g1_i1:5-1144(-)
MARRGATSGCSCNRQVVYVLVVTCTLTVGVWLLRPTPAAGQPPSQDRVEPPVLVVAVESQKQSDGALQPREVQGLQGRAGHLDKKAIDWPEPDWLTPLQSAGQSSLRRSSDAAAWVERTRQWFQSHRCRQTRNPSDCETHEALRAAFWGMEEGLVLELGGLDGLKRSESHPLFKLHNFRRVLVEADLSWRRHRQKVSKDALSIAAAICAEPGHVHYIHGPRPECQGLVEFMSDAYLKDAHPKLWTVMQEQGRAWDSLTLPKGYRFQRVSCVPLGDLLQAVKVPVIDFFVLDVESAELNLLKTVNWNAVRVNVMVVECTGGRFAEIRDFMLSDATGGQFELLFDRQIGRNIWFRHKEFQLNSAPNFDAATTCREQPSQCS